MKKKLAKKQSETFDDKGGRSRVAAKSNEVYMRAVAEEKYPSNLLVPLDRPFVDERGIIQNLLLTNIEGVAIITSKAGTIRSNHWHKTDWHFLYVLQGEMKYYERDLSEDFNDKWILVSQGDMVFTPPCKVHKTVFTKDTVLLSCSRNKRSHELHEQDLVREEF